MDSNPRRLRPTIHELREAEMIGETYDVSRLLRTKPYSPSVPPKTGRQRELQRLALLAMGVDVDTLRSGLPQTTIAFSESDVVTL
jgi:hypothetical protein